MSEENINVTLPSMGEGVYEAKVLRWLKNLKDPITKGMPLLEVSTDKVDTEVAATDSGFLIAAWAQPGQTVAVGTLLGQIGPHAEAQPTQPSGVHPASATAATKQAPTAHAAKTTAPLSQGLPKTYAGRIRSSPLVQKMAADYGLSLGDIRGSGLHGRITSQDVQAYLHTQGGSAASTVAVPEEHLKLKVENGRELLEGVPVRREPMSKMRRLTAEHMLRSVRISPHVTTTFEFVIENIAQHRQKASADEKMTYTAYFVYAVAQVLQKFPELNASVDGSDILYKDDIHLGCAVATPAGLMVPVIKNAHRLSLEETSQALNALVERARQQQLRPDDITGGTFTITNPGIYGSLHSQPIISQPQVGILSLGTVQKKPLVVGNELVIRHCCQVGLTFDHRLVDGEGGAKFLKALQTEIAKVT